VATHAVGPDIADMGRIVTRGFTCLSEIMASTAVHFKVRCLAFIIISVMAIVTGGKGDVVVMVKDHITAAGVEPDLTWGIG